MTDKKQLETTELNEEVLDEADSLGLQFSRARREKKISLEDAANATKIKSSFIKAIERGDFDLLPGGIYTKGYVRTYSDFLGLPTPEIINKLEGLEPGNLSGTTMPYTPQRSERINLKPANWLIGICLLGIFSIVFIWNSRVSDNEHVPDPSNMTISAANGTSPNPEEATQEQAETTVSAEEPINTSNPETPATTEDTGNVNPQNSVTPEVSSTDPFANLQQQLQEAGNEVKTEPVEVPAITENAPAPPLPNAGNPLTETALQEVNQVSPVKKIYRKGDMVTLIAKKRTRIFLYNKSGSQIFEQEVRPGEIFILPQQGDIKIRSENYDALDLKVDNEEVGNLRAISPDAGGMYSVRAIYNALSE